MRAQIVEIEDGERARVVRIRGEVSVGRDPESTLPVTSSRVSRAHVLIYEDDDTYWVVDSGSANGTRLNGEAIDTEPYELRDGDLMLLGESTLLLFEEVEEEPRRRIWIGAGIAAALAVVGIAGAILWSLSTPKLAPIYVDAIDITQGAAAAARAGDSAAALKGFQRAASLLFRSGELDDVARSEAMEVALHRIASAEGMTGREAEAYWRTFQRVRDAEKAPPPPAVAATRQKPGGGPCRLDEMPTHLVEACVRERVDWVLAELRQGTDGMPEEFYRRVGNRLVLEHTIITKALARRDLVTRMIRDALEEARLPVILEFVAMIESGFVRDIRSPAGALGLWQFMPATAREYRLVVDGKRDERRDPSKASQAAAKYLRDLTFEFGGDSMLLVLASYNRGQNGVRRALKQLDDPFSDRSYWKLVETGLLPEETALYVTRFVAHSVAGEAGLPPRDRLLAAGFER